MLQYENFLIVISAPSGAGKSTLIQKLLNYDKNIKVSISATTREPREGEQNGVDYNFLTKYVFEQKIKENAFIEYAKVYDNYYGTLKEEIENKWREGHDVVLDINWEGARSISDYIKSKQLLKIFILPPTIKELGKRLKERATDSIEVIEKRMLRAKDDIAHYNEYNYFIINNDLDIAFEELKSIILVKRKQNVKQEALDDFIQNM